MDILTEIRAAVRSGLAPFKQKIDIELQNNEHYLDSLLWNADGTQISVLNCLVALHLEQNDEEEPVNLIEFINYIIPKVNDKNKGEPLHQAILAEKYDLAIYLLDLNVFNVDQRDIYGNTLLSLALSANNDLLLRALFKAKPATQHAVLTKGKMILQPVHEAVLHDSALAIYELAQAGAKLDNPAGLLRDTPLLLAARHGKINALSALLAQDVNTLGLKRKCIDGANALDLLGNFLQIEPQRNDLLKGIAMLLCHGEEPPQSPELCQLLSSKRKKLLQEISVYLADKPLLVDSFVARCHDERSSLHAIIYEESTWSYFWHKLFGRPSSTAFQVENLVSHKHQIDEKAATTFAGTEAPSVLYAEFVRRYDATYSMTRITNPWSKMRWMIASGKCGWGNVVDYAHAYPHSRTGIILHEMLKVEANEDYQGDVITTLPTPN